MLFTVSVIIPVYNVAEFIKKTITSVLIQPEVTEIVLVDDGSKDNSLEIIKKLQKKHPIIKVYQHKNGVNKGRGATRNLGIIKATSNYIAFLDADDFYLENRFFNDKKILENLINDGTYNAVGFHFYRETKLKEAKHFKLNTVSKKMAPEDLFFGLVKSKYGFLHLNGITIKKEAFDTIGLINENLIVAEDTDIIWKMALKCRLQPSAIEKPLAMRGIHDDNVFINDALYKKYTPKCFESLIDWSFKKRLDQKKIEALLDALWVFKFEHEKGIITHIGYWITLMIKFPRLFFSILSIKYFPIIRLRKKIVPYLYKS